jgi:hypothetical protein
VSPAYNPPAIELNQVAADGDLADSKIPRKIPGRCVSVFLNDLENPLKTFFLDQSGHII